MDGDAQWIRRIQKRHSRADADRLIRAYYDEIFVFALRQLGERDTAMDVTQEIFISMLQSLSLYDPKIATFRTWLYRIATNKLIDHRRKQRPATLSWDAVALPDPYDFVETVEKSEKLEKVRRFIDGLDGDLQRIFRLRHFEEFGFPEIAARMGQPEATIKTRYYRMMKRLRKEFSDDPHTV